MQKRWTIQADDKEQTNLLQKTLNIHPVLCKILSQRGIDSFDKAKDFFRPQLTALHDACLMKDMDKAVDRILSAISNQEKNTGFWRL